MRALVTGGTGFLGRHLCRRLRDEGVDVVALGSQDCDLTEDGSLQAAVSGDFDRIFHLAAWTQAGDFCLHHPGEQWIINQRINTNVLAWWQREQPQAKIICMGTSCAYDPQRPLEEDQYMLGEPISSLYSYAMTKRMLLCGLQALSRQYGLGYLYVVPSTLYGPGYHTDGRQMHFIFDLIRKIMRGKLLDEEVVLWGDGYQCRELVLVSDFVDLLLRLDEAAENDIINIGAGEEYPIRTFAQIICQQVGYDPDAIQYDESRYVGARSKCLATNKLHSILADVDLTPLEDGLRQTVDWFEQHKEHLIT